MSKSKGFFRFLAYSIEVIVIYILIGTPSLIPEVYGSKPCLLIPLAISVAIYENEIGGIVFGIICGGLTDIGFGNGLGWYAVSMAVICFFIGYFAENIIMTNLPVILIIGFISTVFTIGISFCLKILIKDIDYPWIYFLNHYLSRILYTFIFVPVFYYINRFVATTLSNQ